MKKLNYKSDWLTIFIGSVLTALGVAFFADPAHMAPGGVSGIAVILKDLTGRIGWAVPLALTNAILNIPLFIICGVQRGFKFLSKTIYATIVLTVGLAVFEYVYPFLPSSFLALSEDMFLETLCAGALCGLGTGMVLKAGATTGGTDTLASIVKIKFPHLRMSVLILIIDAVIVFASSFIFGLKEALYAIVLGVIGSFVTNFIVEGGQTGKSVFIISDQLPEIAETLMEKLQRGATIITAKGAYTKVERNMLYIVVSQKEVPILVRLVKEIDADSFVTVTDIREVLGEGFDTYDAINKLNTL